MMVTVPGLEPDLTHWDAWTPDRVAGLLTEVDAPWYVAAGWALDLFLGEQQREHGDLEIAVPGDRFAEIEDALAELDFFALTGPERRGWLVDALRIVHPGHPWIEALEAVGR